MLRFQPDLVELAADGHVRGKYAGASPVSAVASTLAASSAV